VADTCHSKVRRYSASGELQAEYTGGDDRGTRLEQPVDVAVAEDGTVYVADLRQRVVELDSTNGAIRRSWTVHVGTTRGAANLAVAGRTLYLTDPDRDTIAVIETDSGQVRQIGESGRGPGQLRVPVGIAVGLAGNIYVADSDNARVQVLGDVRSR
jgi:DNA-binding beta-propeller fold protein YncE